MKKMASMNIQANRTKQRNEMLEKRSEPKCLDIMYPERIRQRGDIPWRTNVRVQNMKPNRAEGRVSMVGNFDLFIRVEKMFR